MITASVMKELNGINSIKMCEDLFQKIERDCWEAIMQFLFLVRPIYRPFNQAKIGKRL